MTLPVEGLAAAKRRDLLVTVRRIQPIPWIISIFNLLWSWKVGFHSALGVMTKVGAPSKLGVFI